MLRNQSLKAAFAGPAVSRRARRAGSWVSDRRTGGLPARVGQGTLARYASCSVGCRVGALLMQGCPRSLGEALCRPLGDREGSCDPLGSRGVGRADACRRIGERSRRLPGGARWMDASGTRSYGTNTNQRRCGMSSSSGTGSLSLAKGGPATQEGKEVVKWNATRHGIRSPAPVVPGVEKAEDWEEHRDGVLESLQPEGHLELVLAERVALLSWRLHRVTRFETESIALYQEQIEEDLAQERRLGSRVLGADHPEEVRWKLKDAQRTHRTLKKLPRLPDDKHLSGGDAAGVL